MTPTRRDELLKLYATYAREAREGRLSLEAWDKTPDDTRETRRRVIASPHYHRMREFSRWLKEKNTPKPEVDEGEGQALQFHKYGRVTTYRWADDTFRYVAQVIPDEGGDALESVVGGSVSDAEPASPERAPWFMRKECPTHGRSLRMGVDKVCGVDDCKLTLLTLDRPGSLRGSDRHHWWMIGGYHRHQGERSYREYNYGQLDYFNYFDLRTYYWLEGATRYEADRLAREAFNKRRSRLEEWAEGNLSAVGVVTYLFPLAEEEEGDTIDPLADDVIWGIESDADTSYLIERALDCGHQAKLSYESSNAPPKT